MLISQVRLYLRCFSTRNAKLLWRSVCAICAILWLAGCASYTIDEQDDTLLTQSRVHFVLSESPDVDELVYYAQHHHPQVRAAYAQTERAQAAAIQAGAWADPQLSVSQGLTDSGWQTIAIEQEIPIFQRRQIAVAQAQSNVKLAQAQLQQTKAEVAQQVKQALADYLYIQQSQAIQQDVVAIFEQSAAVAQSRYESGQAPMAELLRAQNSVDQARVEGDNLQNMLQSTQARLNTALGRDARTALPQMPDLPTTHAQFAILPAAEDDLYDLLDEYNPALLASRYALQERVAAADLADRAGRPRLMLGLEYMNTDMGDGMPAAMASVSLPIWRSAYRAGREAAAADLESSRAQWQSAQQDAHAELSMALYQWREAERNKTLYGDVLVSRAERAVASTLSNYQTGNASYSDLVASQQEWLTFALNYQRALADQLIAAAVIESLTVLPSLNEVSHE